MDKIYTINFETSNKDEWITLNGKNMFMDYEENIIEQENFEGFSHQIIAEHLGLTK